MSERAKSGNRNDVPASGCRPASADPHVANAYWRRNLRYVALLLLIWFAVSFGGGIVFARPLNAIRVPGTGFPLGFWIAQQGAIYTFIVLIFVYVYLMNRLDRKFGVEERDTQ